MSDKCKWCGMDRKAYYTWKCGTKLSPGGPLTQSDACAEIVRLHAKVANLERLRDIAELIYPELLSILNYWADSSICDADYDELMREITGISLELSASLKDLEVQDAPKI